jgi:hypothetical protein
MGKFSSPFMAKSPLHNNHSDPKDNEKKRTKIETEGKRGPDGKPQGSTEYVNKSGNRSVEIAKDFAGNQRKTVRRRKKDGTIKTKSKVISEKRAARIKRRKDKKT